MNMERLCIAASNTQSTAARLVKPRPSCRHICSVAVTSDKNHDGVTMIHSPRGTHLAVRTLYHAPGAWPSCWTTAVWRIFQPVVSDHLLFHHSQWYESAITQGGKLKLCQITISQGRLGCGLQGFSFLSLRLVFLLMFRFYKIIIL